MTGFQCISTPLYPGNKEPVAIEIEEITHEQGAAILSQGFDISASDWPDGYAISNEIVTLSTHQGTHIDAPKHYSPDGEDICAFDIHNFMGQAVVVTDRQSPGPEVVVDYDEYRAKLDRYAGRANAVFFITGAYERYGEESYFLDFKGVPPQLVEAALDRGYSLIGTDGFSLDPPFAVMSDRFLSTRDPKTLWPTHVLGRRRPYFQLERLYDLKNFEGANLVDYFALPIKLHCGAAWTRAIARIVE
ncbi:MAG: cyclase family protein [Reinekea sp.]|nr:cyclase family protein [Reinekea sp.]MDX1472621.1 cyclase family protein [Reinekea sp.]